MYWSAIVLDPAVSAVDVGEVSGTVCDPWGRLELAGAGFVELQTAPWFLRAPGRLPDPSGPSGLEIVRVSTPRLVAEFEAVSVRGFAGPDAAVETGAIHPPSILQDRRMTMLIGRGDGRAVAAAMSYPTGTVVGVFGVTTVGNARRRGYATALTRALIDPALPTVLSSSPEAEGVYRRLGFQEAGRLRQWIRTPDRAGDQEA